MEPVLCLRKKQNRTIKNENETFTKIKIGYSSIYNVVFL